MDARKEKEMKQTIHNLTMAITTMLLKNKENTSSLAQSLKRSYDALQQFVEDIHNSINSSSDPTSYIANTVKLMNCIEESQNYPATHRVDKIFTNDLQTATSTICQKIRQQIPSQTKELMQLWGVKELKIAPVKIPKETNKTSDIKDYDDLKGQAKQFAEMLSEVVAKYFATKIKPGKTSNEAKLAAQLHAEAQELTWSITNNNETTVIEKLEKITETVTDIINKFKKDDDLSRALRSGKGPLVNEKTSSLPTIFSDIYINMKVSTTTESAWGKLNTKRLEHAQSAAIEMAKQMRVVASTYLRTHSKSRYFNSTETSVQALNIAAQDFLSASERKEEKIETYLLTFMQSFDLNTKKIGKRGSFYNAVEHGKIKGQEKSMSPTLREQFNTLCATLPPQTIAEMKQSTQETIKAKTGMFTKK